tara:strand:+ start:992 stop:1327 length:336 start_codon:yes stop_codon:yes gene_type:complete
MYYYVVSGLMGAVVAVLIAMLARSNYFILAGLAPLFPTFALFAHILSYRVGGNGQVRDVALFGAFSIIPYLFYVLGVYFALTKFRFEIAIPMGLVLWAISAAIVYVLWNRA